MQETNKFIHNKIISPLHNHLAIQIAIILTILIIIAIIQIITQIIIKIMPIKCKIVTLLHNQAALSSVKVAI